MTDVNNVVKKKNANIELLRLISMVFVLTTHLLDKGGTLQNPFETGGVSVWIAWFIEALAVCSLNIFMLISGYFLVRSRFKLGRLLEIVFAAVFYAVGAFAVCLLTGAETLSGKGIYDLLDKIFPIHMNLYWFITSYVIIYILSPLLNKGINALKEKQLRLVIVLLLIYECAFKTILPVRLSTDKGGYTTFWFLIVYVIGAYIRLYGIKWLEKPGNSGIAFLISLACVYAETIVIMYINSGYGRLKEIKGISLEHNHVFLLIESLSLFCFFLYKKQMAEGAGRIVCAVSPMALGIYLVHENMSVRYKWQAWLHVDRLDKLGPGMFFAKLLFGVAVVTALGLILDFIRIELVKLIRYLFKDSKLTASMKRFDGAINDTDG